MPLFCFHYTRVHIPASVGLLRASVSLVITVRLQNLSITAQRLVAGVHYGIGVFSQVLRPLPEPSAFPLSRPSGSGLYHVLVRVVLCSVFVFDFFKNGQYMSEGLYRHRYGNGRVKIVPEKLN